MQHATPSCHIWQVVIRGEVQHMRNKVKEANEAAEALAKAIYSTPSNPTLILP